MKVITVRQPWAWAIIHGGKDVENRTRNIVGSYRGPVAIHAALGWSEQGAEDWEVRRALRSEEVGRRADDSETWAGESVEEADPRLIRGHIIGTVNLLAVHSATMFCCPNRGVSGNSIPVVNKICVNCAPNYTGLDGLAKTIEAITKARIEADNTTEAT